MQIGSSSFYDIGTNYSIKLNDKEALVFEDDPLRKTKTKEEQIESDAADKKEVEKSKSTDELTVEEQQMLYELQARDSEVRAHEAAHQSAGAATGGASYTYQQGPDGKMYAIGGEVSISYQTGSTPQETIANAQAVIAAALAPADPSGQDLAVASSAMLMMQKAQQELTRQTQEELLGKEIYKNASSENTSIESDQNLNHLDISA